MSIISGIFVLLITVSLVLDLYGLLSEYIMYLGERVCCSLVVLIKHCSLLDRKFDAAQCRGRAAHINTRSNIDGLSGNLGEMDPTFMRQNAVFWPSNYSS